jgi:hypothetical protein
MEGGAADLVPIASPGCDAGPHSNLRFYVKHLASGTVRTEPRRR